MLNRIKLLWASARLIRDPNRLDEVFQLADSIADERDLAEMVDAIAATGDGPARSFAEKPRVTFDRAALAALPPGTLGREFHEFLARNELDPEVFLGRPANSETEFAITHLYETHDLWHVVTGFATDVAGELGLQAFYLAQFPDRLSMLLLPLGMLNGVIFDRDDIDRRMSEIARGWRLGKAARPLFGVDWSSMWDTPLSEIRARFGLEVAATTANAA